MNQPEQKYRYGAVSATIWKRENRTQDGRAFQSRKVLLERSYKDAAGNWQSTNTYDANDLPKAILALSRAYAYLSGKGEDED